MDRMKIEATLKRIDMSTFPIFMKLSLNPACHDGKTRVSAALKAPDVHGSGKDGPRDGLWPPHSIELEDDSEASVIAAARSAAVKALGHEVDEHMKFDGAIVNDPHPMV